jgi:hypothetical protein
MLDHWPRLPWAFPWALAICEEAWRQRALAGIESDPPPYVSAVATVLGTDAFALWDRLEGLHGWESHDEGYGQRVWQEAWCRSCGPLPPAQMAFRPSQRLREAVPWRLG